MLKTVEKPIFSFTSDQDWAPAWALEEFLTLTQRYAIPVHFFRTSPCPILDKAASKGKITQGWHPNFLPNSSHGSDINSVITYMKQHFPDATTIRSHAFAESTPAWEALAREGIRADSQMPTLFQAGLQPLLHPSGIVRFPVFFEDDVFFDYCPGALSLEPVLDKLFSPGLKVLNFHATFVACNIPSREYYEKLKPAIFSENSQKSSFLWNGRGTRHVFEELIAAIIDSGHEFVRFPDLVEQN
jgi:hypothetical protein